MAIPPGPGSQREPAARAELEKLMKLAGATGGGEPPSSKPEPPPALRSVAASDAALASAILPGLGQWLSGRRERGLGIFASAIAIAAVAGWWASESGSIYWWLALLPFWIAQVLDAAALVRGEAASVARLALMGMLPVYLVGWQATEIDLAKPVQRWDKVQPFFRGLAQPDFLDPVLETTEARIQVWTPCHPKEASEIVEPSDEAPSVAVEPACAGLGETLRVTGAGFAADVQLDLVWRGPTGDEVELIGLDTDDAGRFEAEIVIPLESIPARVRERRPDVPQDQALKAVSAIDTGRHELSETMQVILENIGVTIALGFMATVLGSLLAVPLSLLGARNLMGRSRGGRWVYWLARGLLNVVRSIESLILAVVFVVWVGQGPFAGVLALTVHTVAAIGKLFSEAIESIDEGPIEAVRATGASWSQVVRYAVLPQVLPPFTAFTVYRWDINVRMSTILGFVGGGGIGFVLQQWIAKSRWSETSTAVVVIALVLVLLDLLSSFLRERLAEGRSIVPDRLSWLRPALAVGLVVFAAWAWQTSEIDLARLVRDADKARPIIGQLLRPDLIEAETVETRVSMRFEGGCSADSAAADLAVSGTGEADLIVTSARPCAFAGEDLSFEVQGLAEAATARLRWLLPDGRRLPAGSVKVDDGAAVARVEVRPLVIEQIEASGKPAYIELEAATPTGRIGPSEALNRTLDNILESILMALMASTFGAFLAMPLAFLGARNIMPRTPLGTSLYYVSRTFMNVSRAIEPLVLAAVFAAWVGVGSPFAGVLALIWVTMANLGKLFSESVENINAGPIEAVAATGAGRVQQIWYAVVPQVVPPFLAFGIYHWDINVRISTIVGFVGGGGIGFVLYEWMKVTQWRSAAVAILAIIIVVTAMDTISARVRARLV